MRCHLKSYFITKWCATAPTPPSLLCFLLTQSLPTAYYGAVFSPLFSLWLCDNTSSCSIKDYSGWRIFPTGETFKNRSLIIPVVYKTVLFSFLVAIFSTLEHLIETRIHGKTLLEFYDSFMAHGKDALLAKILVVFWFFILFFSFLEISSALGEGKLFHLFFKRKSTEL